MNDPIANWFAGTHFRIGVALRSVFLSRKTVVVVVLLLIAGVAAFVLTPRGTRSNIPLNAATDDLKATTVEATLDSLLDANKNTIWCVSAPSAWKALKEVVDGDIEIENAPPWVGDLNRSAVGSSEGDPDALVTGVGRIGQGVVEAIQARVCETFGGGRDPWLDRFADGLDDDILLAYAYLATRLEFPEPFDPIPGGLLYFVSGKKANERKSEIDEEKPAEKLYDRFWAQAFGFKSTFDAEDPRHQRIANHVRIHGYEPAEREHKSTPSYVVVLEGKSEKGDVILARLEPRQTLRATAEAALAKLSLAPDRLGDGDWLRIPVFDFHVSRSYRELIGKRILNPGFDQGHFVRVMQSVRFRLDENGADLRSRMGAAYKSCISPRIKLLIFTPPFLLLLKGRHAKQPYFAMWVANRELLVRQE
jgi:hypothetical protein